MNVNDDPIRAAMTPVFERLGAAVYVCQSFEHSIAYLIALAMQSLHNDGSGEVLKVSLERSSARTLGQLLAILPKSVSIEEIEVDTLRLGLQLRNRLVHYWLHDNVERILTPPGRLDSIECLEATISGFRIANSIVNKYIDQYLARYGLSTEGLKGEVDSTWQSLNFDSFDDLPPKLQ